MVLFDVDGHVQMERRRRQRIQCCTGRLFDMIQKRNVYNSKFSELSDWF